MGIHTFLFGHTSSGEPVFARTVGNRNGMRMTVLDYGATIQSLCVPDRNGVMRDIVCGYDDVYGYEKDTTYCGAIVGRWANRIGKGAFSLDGKSYTLACNNGENHLHGGSVGYSHRTWACREEGEDTLSFALDSPDGEEGYPGTLHITVTYRLTEDNALSIRYFAQAESKSVINLTNHTYFNLGGFASGDVLRQQLRLDADAYLRTDAGLIPTGEIVSVIGTPFDFTKSKPIGQDLFADCADLHLAGGYDHCFCFPDGAQSEAVLRGCAYDPESGCGLELYTDQPCVQLYTANFLKKPDYPLKGGYPQAVHHAFCLETERMPDSMNHPGFTACTINPDAPYTNQTIYRFFAK